MADTHNALNRLIGKGALRLLAATEITTAYRRLRFGGPFRPLPEMVRVEWQATLPSFLSSALTVVPLIFLNDTVSQLAEPGHALSLPS